MPENHSDNIRLDSWKEIATYLRKDVRTVIRWEKEKNLPVHRVPGGQRKAVFAYRSELDMWLQNGDKVVFTDPSDVETEKPACTEGTFLDDAHSKQESKIRPRKHGVRDLTVILAAIATVAMVMWVIQLYRRANHKIQLTKVNFIGNAIQALDQENHVIWAHNYSKAIDTDIYGRNQLLGFTRIVDLKKDGNRELLAVVPLRIGPNPDDGTLTEVDCFSSSGEFLWSYIPQKTFKFGNYQLQGPWHVFDIFVASRGGGSVIWVAFAHHEWGNSFVVELDPITGKDALRFVNTGVLYKLNELTTSTGSYLLAAGFNNEYGAGSLAIIDTRQGSVASPQTAGTRHKCVSCPAGVPDYYFVFPRSEINLAKNAWEDSVKSIRVNGQDFEISKMELGDGGQENNNGAVRSIYLFHTSPLVRPFSFRFDSSYDMLHRQLEKESKLNHSLETCPERLHPKPVQVWTPSTGWTQVELQSTRAVD